MSEQAFPVAVVRPTVGDAEAIAEIFNLLEREHYGVDAVGVGEVRRWFRLPNVELLAAKTTSGALVAYADLHHEDEGRRFWLDLREHPRRREMGGARLVLAEAEAWAGERAAAGALFRAAAASEDRVLLALYANAGYTPVRHNLEMGIALDDDVPEPRWPRGITVRTLASAQDQRRVYEADMEAFEDHWEFVRWRFDEWRAWMVDDPRFDPSLWFLAEEGDDLAGFCLGVVHASGDPSFGHVALLGVRRPWRRRGLGLALLQHAFREFRRRGMTRANLDVDAENLTGAVRLYERAGMHVVKRRITYEKAL